MSNLTGSIRYCKQGTNTYRYLYPESDEIAESKPDWKCTLCQYCTSTKCDMYQIATEERFNRVCNCCLRMDYFDFIYGDMAKEIKEIININKNKKKI